MDLLCRDVKLVTGEEVEREYRFHPERKFRLDGAIVRLKIAFEVDGGVFVGGRHSRGVGIENDCIKYGLAAMLGWRIIRCTPRLVKNGLAVTWIEAVVRQELGR